MQIHTAVHIVYGWQVQGVCKQSIWETQKGCPALTRVVRRTTNTRPSYSELLHNKFLLINKNEHRNSRILPMKSSHFPVLISFVRGNMNEELATQLANDSPPVETCIPNALLR